MENALETPAFLKNIEIVKNDTYSELKEKLYKAKLSAIRDF